MKSKCAEMFVISNGGDQKMKFIRITLLLTLLLPCYCQGLAQEADTLRQDRVRRWGLGLEFDYLFDNREHETSPIGESYTLSGVWVKPHIYLNVDREGHQKLHFGVNLLQEFGVNRLFNLANLTAYYHLKHGAWDMRAGMFPSRLVTAHMSERMIDQATRFKMPVMSGLQVSHTGTNHFVNMWIDWITKQSEVDRERFQAGLSARYVYGGLFSDLQFRMMHLATALEEDPLSIVVDDLQGEWLLGYERERGVWSYRLALGLYATLERDRVVEEVHRNIGGLATFNLAWRHKLWLDGYLYYGTGHQQLRKKYGRLLYFEHPFLQAPFYLQTTGNWQILSTRRCDMRLELGLHFLQRSLSSHQALIISVRL